MCMSKKSQSNGRNYDVKKKLLLTVATVATLSFASLGAINTDAASFDCNSMNINKNIKVYKTVEIGKYKWNSCTSGNSNTGTNLPTVETPETDVNQPTVDTPQIDNNQSEESTPEISDDEQTNDSTVSDYEVSAFEKEVLELTNAERAKQGLSPLTLDTELSKVARIKSQDMKDKNYFSHTSPTYGSPFDMMKQFGISYSAAAENIAQGQTTPEQVVQAWMNSQGHRENILNASYTHIGIGYVADGNYWTQMFISK